MSTVSPDFDGQQTQPSQASFEELLKCEISGSFRQCGYRELDGLEIEVDGHDVTLRGTLPTYYLRQKAAALVLSNQAVATLQTVIEICAVDRQLKTSR